MFLKQICCLVLTVLIFSSCGFIKPVAVTSVGNFKTVNPLLRPEIRFEVGLYNPNNFSVTIEKMEVGLSLGGPVLGTITTLEGTSITKKESILVPLSLAPSLTDISTLLNSGISEMLAGTSSQQLEVKGQVVIKKFFFRRRYEIKESIRL